MVIRHSGTDLESEVEDEYEVFKYEELTIKELDSLLEKGLMPF